MPYQATVVSDTSGSWSCGAFSTGSCMSVIPTSVASRMGTGWYCHQGVDSNSVKGSHIWYVLKQVTGGINVKQYMAGVNVLSTGATRDPHMAHLFCCLFFLGAYFGFEHKALHTAGWENVEADTLSRNKLPEFFSFLPQAHLWPPSEFSLSPSTLLLDPSLTWIYCLARAPCFAFGTGFTGSTATYYLTAKRRYLAFLQSYNLPPSLSPYTWWSYLCPI